MRRPQKDAVALYHALNELIRIYQFRDRDRICCHDISITQCHALEGLVHHGPLMLNKLADYLHLDKSTTSRVVDSLERKGYATRLVHPDDSRALELKATPAGVRLHQVVMAEILKLKEEEGVLSDLSAESDERCRGYSGSSRKPPRIGARGQTQDVPLHQQKIKS